LTLCSTQAGEQPVIEKDERMTTLFRTLTTNKYSGRPNFFRLGVAASVAALLVGMAGSRIAHGQVPPLQITELAHGFSPTKTPNMRVNGATDTLQTLLVFQPGGETGWHIHPGPVVVVVKSGALTETHSNGCMTVHLAGSAFFETAGEVHNAANQTGGVTEAYVTFISPAGSQPLIPVSNSGNICRQGDDHQEDKY
jgi:quercetin dioxygenase-like cupin family protein